MLGSLKIVFQTKNIKNVKQYHILRWLCTVVNYSIFTPVTTSAGGTSNKFSWLMSEKVKNLCANFQVER